MEDFRFDRGVSGDPFIMFQGGDPSDTRFQFEIIKGLAESIRQLTGSIQDMQKTQVSMLERLAVLEANKVGEKITELDGRVDALLRDKDRRDGALGMIGILRVWGPVIFSALAAIWLYGRTFGLVPAPSAAPARVEATIHPEERKIEGTVGGKP